ncbi:hypothetical protein [Actinophytocola sediminis]
MAAKVEPREDDDFLAFWEQHRAAENPPETKRILGVDVVVPTDVPLSFEDISRELAESKRPEDFEQLLGMLFGEGTLEAWKANKLTGKQLRVLVAWGMANGSGKSTTFAEAAELVAKAEQLKAEADAEGKAPGNRAARRASSRTPASGGTGRTSSRTSGASTGSRRKS